MNWFQPTSDGFKWEIEGHGTGAVNWEDVESVELFKRDLISTDIVCMNFKSKAGGYFLLHEEVKGFVDTVRAMSSYWGLGDDWYRRVVFPPFETCRVTIKPLPKLNSTPRAEMIWAASKT